MGVGRPCCPGCQLLPIARQSGSRLIKQRCGPLLAIRAELSCSFSNKACYRPIRPDPGSVRTSILGTASSGKCRTGITTARHGASLAHRDQWLVAWGECVRSFFWGPRRVPACGVQFSFVLRSHCERRALAVQLPGAKKLRRSGYCNPSPLELLLNAMRGAVRLIFLSQATRTCSRSGPPNGGTSSSRRMPPSDSIRAAHACNASLRRSKYSLWL